MADSSALIDALQAEVAILKEENRIKRYYIRQLESRLAIGTSDVYEHHPLLEKMFRDIKALINLAITTQDNIAALKK